MRSHPVLRFLALGCLLLGSGAVGACGGSDEDDSPRVIVSIGDSVASGEGNPTDQGRSQWLPPAKCHRSPLSGHRLAAAQIHQRDPEIGFVSWACSGATVTNGLVGPFRPKLLALPEPPQLERLRERAERSTVEAVLVSIGANDVGFSKIVEFCATEPKCYTSTRYSPARRWADQQGKPDPTLRDFVAMKIQDLGDLYAQVDDGIPSEIPRERVMIVEYFDPTRYPGRTQCAIFRKQVLRFFSDDLVKTDESAWAHDEVLIPLNDAIAAAADEHGWTLVQGIDEDFEGHGICAPPGERWVLSLGDSLTRQGDHLGTLHPNNMGQRMIGDRILGALTDQLGPAD